MTRALLFTLVALGLSACQTPETTPPDALGADPASPPLLGTEWRLAAIDGAPVASNRLITVTFTDQPWEEEDGFRSLGGYDGCNNFGMAYRLDGDRVEVGGVIADAMACGPPGAHVSDSVHVGFAAARRVRIDGDRLALTDSLGDERLAFVPRPVRAVDPAAVTTGRWRLDPAASTVTNSYGGAPGRYDVAFAGDSTYTGSAGCRTFQGRYRLDGDRLWVQSYTLSDQACAPDDRMWDGPHGLSAGEIEADEARLVVHLRTGGRAVFRRP